MLTLLISMEKVIVLILTEPESRIVKEGTNLVPFLILLFQLHVFVYNLRTIRRFEIRLLSSCFPL